MRNTLWVRRAISHATSCDQLPSCLGGSQPHGLDKPSPGICALAAVPPAYNEREARQTSRDATAPQARPTPQAPPLPTSPPGRSRTSPPLLSHLCTHDHERLGLATLPRRAQRASQGASSPEAVTIVPSGGVTSRGGPVVSAPASAMAGEREAAAAVDSGEKRLNELGYKQELRREMVRFSSARAS